MGEINLEIQYRNTFGNSIQKYIWKFNTQINLEIQYGNKFGNGEIHLEMGEIKLQMGK